MINDNCPGDKERRSCRRCDSCRRPDSSTFSSLQQLHGTPQMSTERDQFYPHFSSIQKQLQKTPQMTTMLYFPPGCNTVKANKCCLLGPCSTGTGSFLDRISPMLDRNRLIWTGSGPCWTGIGSFCTGSGLCQTGSLVQHQNDRTRMRAVPNPNPTKN